MSVLATAIPAHDDEVISLAVDAVGGELRDLTEHIPDRRDFHRCQVAKTSAISLARLSRKPYCFLRRIGIDADDGNYNDAASDMVIIIGL